MFFNKINHKILQGAVPQHGGLRFPGGLRGDLHVEVQEQFFFLLLLSFLLSSRAAFMLMLELGMLASLH